MTRDDVIRWAREAGFTLLGNHAWDGFDATIERFAALVMEEAAKVCDDKAENYETQAQEALKEGELDDVIILRSTAWRISVCAAAIRARKP